MFTNELGSRLDDSSLSDGVESYGEVLKAGDVLKAGLVVKWMEELVSIGEPSRVMYPGSESVPCGVTWLCARSSGKSKVKSSERCGSCGA